MIRSPLRRTQGLRRSRMTLKTKSDGNLGWWRKCVKAVYGDTCLRCGRQAPQWKIDTAHILGRGPQVRLKYVPENGIRLCFLCHRWFDTHKGSHHNGEADLWVRATVGEDRYTRLLILATIPQKEDPIGTRLYLQARLKDLQKASL